MVVARPRRRVPRPLTVRLVTAVPAQADTAVVLIEVVARVATEAPGQVAAAVAMTATKQATPVTAMVIA